MLLPSFFNSSSFLCSLVEFIALNTLLVVIELGHVPSFSPPPPSRLRFSHLLLLLAAGHYLSGYRRPKDISDISDSTISTRSSQPSIHPSTANIVGVSRSFHCLHILCIFLYRPPSSSSTLCILCWLGGPLWPSSTYSVAPIYIELYAFY